MDNFPNSFALGLVICLIPFKNYNKDYKDNEHDMIEQENSQVTTDKATSIYHSI